MYAFLSNPNIRPKLSLPQKKLYELTVQGIRLTNPDFASIILNLMSKDNLGNKQAIIIHNCLINDDKYDLVIPPLSKIR